VTDAAEDGARHDVVTLFAALWAVAALFHALGPSGRAGGIVDDVTAAGVGHVLLVVAALWVLAAPDRLLPLVALAVLGPVTAWQEAPFMGNHWLVVAFVDVGLLLSIVAARRPWRGALVEGGGFLPVARWTLAGFYAFAGFAKLNHGFLDTTVSCASVYFDETARTLGLSTPMAVGKGGFASLVPVVAALVEVSIPVLLCMRRTRIAGVVLGLLFHSAIALDQEHLFSDFSSVLAALFVLFLPQSFAAAAVDLVRRRGRAALAAWAGLAAVVSAAQWSGRGGLVDSVFVDGRMWLWFTYDAALLAAVAWWLLRKREAAPRRPFALPRRNRWLAIVPVIVIANGLTPYVELKTGYAYTMYANLVTVGGDTNHLLLPATLTLGDRQTELVTIQSSSDPSLAVYASAQYRLPWDSFRAYVSSHPTAAVRYERAGEVHDLAHASDEPGLTDGPSTVVQKLLPLRAVDERDPPRCQESFLPAL
jgi:hypothetical protein